MEVIMLPQNDILEGLMTSLEITGAWLGYPGESMWIFKNTTRFCF